MKFIKMLGLLAVAAAALMVFAGTASADTLTGPNGEPTPTIHAVTEGGHAKLSNPVAAIECPSTAEGTVESHESGKKVKGKITTLTFGHVGNTCTGGWTVTVVANGELSVEWKAPGEGTVFSTGTTVIAHRLGITCNYLTNTTDIGTLTDHTKTPKNPAGESVGATLDINGEIPLHSGSSALCGTAPGKWSGSYYSTTKLTIHDT